MNIPGLGELVKDERFDWYYSQPIEIAVFGGMKCQIVVEGYEEDECKAEFHEAISNLLSASPLALKDAEIYIYQYYEDIHRLCGSSHDEFPIIKSPSEIWAHISLGSEPMVSRRSYGDHKIYISLECNCDWEPEHGLQIVFFEGKKVCKVGPYDGHLTNSDAFANEKFEHVIYRRIA